MSEPAGPSGRKCSKTEVSRDDELKTTKGTPTRSKDAQAVVTNQ